MPGKRTDQHNGLPIKCVSMKREITREKRAEALSETLVAGVVSASTKAFGTEAESNEAQKFSRSRICSSGIHVRVCLCVYVCVWGRWASSEQMVETPSGNREALFQQFCNESRRERSEKSFEADELFTERIRSLAKRVEALSENTCTCIHVYVYLYYT